MQNKSGQDNDDSELRYHQAAANIDSQMGDFFNELVEKDLDGNGPLVVLPVDEPLVKLAAFNNTANHKVISDNTAEITLFDPITQEHAAAETSPRPEDVEDVETIDLAEQPTSADELPDGAADVAQTPQSHKTSELSVDDLDQEATTYQLDDFAPEDLDFIGTYSPARSQEERKDKLLFAGAVATGVTVLVLIVLILSGGAEEPTTNLALDNNNTTTSAENATAVNSPSTFATVSSAANAGGASATEVPNLDTAPLAPTTLVPPTTSVASSTPATTATATTRRATTTTTARATTTTAPTTTATTRHSTTAAPSTITETQIQSPGYSKDIASASMTATYTAPDGVCLQSWELSVTDPTGTETETGTFDSPNTDCQSEWSVSVPSSGLQVGTSYTAELTGTFTNGSSGQISSDFVAE